MYKKTAARAELFFCYFGKKSVRTCKVVFLLIRSIVVVFTVLLAFNLSLVLLDFIFSLRNL